MEVPKSLIHRITSSFSDGLHFATPPSSSRTNEVDLVRGLLQILQGLSSSLFYWDNIGKRYCCARSGIYVSHLSYTSLHVILDQFMFAATCLRLVEITIHKVENSVRLPAPTLSAFACSVSAWLRRLRDIALKEEEKVISSDCGTSPTLLGLANSLSSLCSGAEYLLQTVQGAIPQIYFELNSPVPAAEISCHILNHLYKKLIEICHVQDGEEDAYRMLLYLFVGSLLPYVEGLDSWLFEGTLDDPFEEMFFYINKEIAISEAEFWEKSCLLRTTHCLNLDTACTSDLLPRTKDAGGRESISSSSFAKGKEQSARDLQVCPLFVKDIAKAIISAGKSLQLIRHAPMTVSGGNHEIGRSVAGLSLSEIFCVSLMALIGYGDHISEYFLQDDGYVYLFESLGKKPREEGNGEDFLAYGCSEKVWYKFLFDALYQRKEIGLESAHKDVTELPKEKGVNPTSDEIDELALNCKGLCPINPSLTVCQRLLKENKNTWATLNVAGKFHLPPLNDEALRATIFGGTSGQGLEAKGTDYTMGFQFRESGHLRLQNDMKMLQVLFPFPTLLPSFQEDHHISEVLPFQKNSTLPSRVLNWIQNAEPKVTPLPMVVLQECLIVYIRKQVDYIGKHMLTKLLYDWRLMDELGVLRAIYLLGSGDLLQHFLTVIFNKLDKGEHCDDDFELNTILQESIRNSADSMLLTAPDSLVVYITKSHGSGSEEQHRTSNSISTPRKSHGQILGIDGMDSLRFTYKVSWPLELVANMEAMKKYNQVMSFLLKVKRAKFVLDKTRRWMWKDRGAATINRKHHWLVEQKLLHFVDAFHQYVMDRVYHSEWRQLCEGMAAAGSLDEAIDVHENYLLSIQRHCFVVPDKLWALIASRINSILGLALDFYSIQQTLRSGGSVSAIKARCEMEVDRIERQFDDCIAFLLRVLSFKLNVGQFPHLADLVTRINYNYFYMSDSGNLLTAPASDTIASKLGKSFLV